MPVLFHKVVVVGLGQIGTSLALALRKYKVAREIVGVDTNLNHLRIALKRRAIRTGQRRLDDSADLILLAVPVGSILNYLDQIPRGRLVMDIGSTKRGIYQKALGLRLRYIGAHPVAGTEQSGPLAGNPDLFRGKLCFLTIPPHTARGDRQRIEQLWRKIGAEFKAIDPVRHDRLFAAISHLPHAVAFSFMQNLAGPLDLLRKEKVVAWVEGSFRDMTRVASSPEPMWGDIFLDNRQALIPLITGLCKELQRLAWLLRSGDRASLKRWLVQASELKAKLR